MMRQGFTFAQAYTISTARRNNAVYRTLPVLERRKATHLDVDTIMASYERNVPKPQPQAVQVRNEAVYSQTYDTPQRAQSQTPQRTQTTAYSSYTSMGRSPTDKIARALILAVAVVIFWWPILLLYRYAWPRKRVRALVALAPLCLPAMQLVGIIGGGLWGGIWCLAEKYSFQGPTKQQSINKSSITNSSFEKGAPLSKVQQDQCANWLACIYAAHSLETFIHNKKLNPDWLYQSYYLFNEATQYTPSIPTLKEFLNSNSRSYLSNVENKLKSIIGHYIERGLPILTLSLQNELAGYIAGAPSSLGFDLNYAISQLDRGENTNSKLLQSATNIVRESFSRQRIKGKEIIFTDPQRAAYIASYFLTNNIDDKECFQFIYEVFSTVMHPAYALIAVVRFQLAIAGRASAAINSITSDAIKLAELEKFGRLFSWAGLKSDSSVVERMVVCNPEDAEIVFGPILSTGGALSVNALSTNNQQNPASDTQDTPLETPAALNSMKPQIDSAQLAKLRQRQADVDAGFGDNFRSISLKGFRFTLRDGGNETPVLNEMGAPAQALNCVIIAVAPKRHNVLFTGGYSGDDSETPFAVWYDNPSDKVRRGAPANVPTEMLAKRSKELSPFQSGQRAVIALIRPKPQNPAELYIDKDNLYVLDVQSESIWGNDMPEQNAFCLQSFNKYCTDFNIFSCYFATQIIFDPRETVPTIRFIPAVRNGQPNLLPNEPKGGTGRGLLDSMVEVAASATVDQLLEVSLITPDAPPAGYEE